MEARSEPVNPEELKSARRARGWSQAEASRRLGVSQPYYSQIETGARPVTARISQQLARRLRLPPSSLPLPPLSADLLPLSPQMLASGLARLGHPGFSHEPRSRNPRNPALLIAGALAHSDLEPRLVSALPWVLARCQPLDWDWLSAQCRLSNLQNRLGFLLALAEPLALPEAKPSLRAARLVLENSRLAREGTLCRDSMPAAERQWLRRNRSSSARHWRLLTSLHSGEIASRE
ncbi:MAG: helix-turn-helix domain-containing protein [Bryobacteraceae bacterium]|nr:helix-turn-helix transcriptional regulator [Solibacteraceae bacterium]MCO5349375.1 helix-turn-helix domain-containing protein [Bryobacteraceae bacterium]